MSERIPHSRPTVVNGMVELVQKAIVSEHHAAGRYCRQIEETLGRRIAARHRRVVNSGFSALHMALLALETGSGDRVLLPTYVCASLINAIAAVGAIPVLVDIDPDSFNVTEQTLQQALDREGLSATSIHCAIIPHIFGFPSPIHQMEMPFPIIEDCAMALGAQLDGEEVGSWGKLSTFSFYATKMASAGHGGLVATSDEACMREIEDRLRYDSRSNWRPSFNYELSDLQAATLMPQLDSLDLFLSARQSIASAYVDACRDFDVKTQQPHPDAVPNYYRFVILVDEARTQRHLMRDLDHAEIETRAPVFRPLHRYGDEVAPGLRSEDFPGAEFVHEHAVSLPIYPSLTEEERERVVTTLRVFFG